VYNNITIVILSLYLLWFIFDVESDDGNNNNINGSNGKKFTLDDVFNETFYPKLYFAEWVNGMLTCQFVCHCL